MPGTRRGEVMDLMFLALVGLLSLATWGFVRLAERV
jgi:hypothetical protein